MILLRPLLLTWLGALSRSVLFLLLGWILDAALTGTGSLPLLATAAAGAILLESFAACAQQIGYPRAQSRLERTLRRTLVGSLFSATTPPDGRPTGRLVSTATDGVERSAA